MIDVHSIPLGEGAASIKHAGKEEEGQGEGEESRLVAGTRPRKKERREQDKKRGGGGWEQGKRDWSNMAGGFRGTY